MKLNIQLISKLGSFNDTGTSMKAHRKRVFGASFDGTLVLIVWKLVLKLVLELVSHSSALRCWKSGVT